MRHVVACGLAVLFAVGCGRTTAPAPGDAGIPPVVVVVPDPVPGAEVFDGQTPREYAPAYRKVPEADRAFAVLDSALERVWELPDPRDPLAEVIRTAAEVDPVRACDRIRTIGPRLLKLNLPPTRRVVWESFAYAAAGQDRPLRDSLLRLAVANGRRALAAEGLWDELPPEQRKRSLGMSVAQEKLLLDFCVRSWEAVLKLKDGREAALGLLEALQADGEKKGSYGGDSPGRYDASAIHALAHLDADLFIAIMEKFNEKKTVAEICGHQAHSRWGDRQKDAMTGTYVRYAIENGVTRSNVVRVFSRYNFAKAFEVVPRDGRLIVDLAWRDPEAALAVAEREPEEFARRGFIDRVSCVWAYKRPEQIERALKNQDNEVRRSYARGLAAAELEWRKQGNPPRDTPEKAHRLGDPTPSPAAGSPWVPPENVKQLLADPAKVTEADSFLCDHAKHLAQWGPPDHAVDVLKLVKSHHRFVNTATWVARNLIRRAEID